MSNERDEYKKVKNLVDELMHGGPLGDGIGPDQAAFCVNREFGTAYDGREIHAIWTQGQPWATELGGQVGGTDG